MKLRDALAEGERLLAGGGLDTPRIDAELLAESALGLTRLELYLDSERVLSPDEETAYRALLDRRRAREPAAYILGEWGFRRLTLEVDRRVLIPRPGTEAVVERCLELLRDKDEPSVLDAGTGSGAIALAIADEHPGARVTGIDASADALAVAASNLERTGFAPRVRLAQCDLAEPPSGPYDLVVSNPPYVTEEELQGLEPEVRDWEPREALVDRGQTEAIAAAARRELRPFGWLVLEIGDTHAGAVSALLRQLGYTAVSAGPDLTGRDRVVEGRWEPSTTP